MASPGRPPEDLWGSAARRGAMRCGAVQRGTVRRDSLTALRRPRLPLPWGQVPPLEARGLAGPDPRPGIAEDSDWAAPEAETRLRERAGRHHGRLRREGTWRSPRGRAPAARLWRHGGGGHVPGPRGRAAGGAAGWGMGAGQP